MLIDSQKLLALARTVRALYLTAMVAICSPIVCASAQTDKPANWPWRGIVLDSFGGDNDVSDIAKIAATGANAIELVMSVRHTAQFEGMPPLSAWDKNLAWADKMLDACKSFGMIGVITFVQIPLDPALGFRQDSPQFWDDPTQRAEAVRLSGKIAEHFKNRGLELGAYEILNEPVVTRLGRPLRPDTWPSLLDEIVRELRRHDSSRYIVVTPGPGGEASGYANFLPLQYPRIIYGAHVYNPHSFTHQGIGTWKRDGGDYPNTVDAMAIENAIAPLVAFRDKYNALVWIGEFSAVRWAPGSDQYVADCIALFDRLGFGWMYFAYNGYHGWNPSYDHAFATDRPSDWKTHLVGDTTPRWNILRQAFARNRH